MASCKGYRVLKRLKKAKKNVVIADFSKIETQKKVLYVRLKGIPEGGLKALQIKGFRGQIIKMGCVPVYTNISCAFLMLSNVTFEKSVPLEKI